MRVSLTSQANRRGHAADCARDDRAERAAPGEPRASRARRQPRHRRSDRPHDLSARARRDCGRRRSCSGASQRSGHPVHPGIDRGLRPQRHLRRGRRQREPRHRAQLPRRRRPEDRGRGKSCGGAGRRHARADSHHLRRSRARAGRCRSSLATRPSARFASACRRC